MRLLLTGGCGFIGHHFVEHVIKNTDWEIVILDRLNYASKGFDRLRDIACNDMYGRIHKLTADFTLPIVDGLADEIGEVDYIIHMGAETHVENSISDPRPFVYSNVLGTMEMLEFAKTQKNLKKFVYFSTDEVFGPAAQPDQIIWRDRKSNLFVKYEEWDRYNSTNPYSATKAAGEELCLAWANTYGVPVIITHTMNCFGERQHPEKLIPMCIKKILSDEVISIHANADRTKAGSRFWIHCRNVAAAVMFLLDKSDNRDKYNIVGEREVDNLRMAYTIGNILRMRAKCELVDFHSSRPGHDLRYALDGSKMASMGWKPPIGFEDSLEKTIRWYLDHPQWLNWEKERSVLCQSRQMA